MTTPDNDLLVRLDERMSNMSNDLAELKERYVTKDEFQPVRAVVFGGVALILVGFMGALLYITGLQH